MFLAVRDWFVIVATAAAACGSGGARGGGAAGSTGQHKLYNLIYKAKINTQLRGVVLLNRHEY